MEAARVLFLLGGLTMLAVGLLHAGWSLLDVKRPRRFAPRDDRVRRLMTQTTLRLSNRVSMWPAWLGFNISHGLGLVFFGLTILLIGIYDFRLLRAVPPLQPLIVVVSAAYCVLSIRFWFFAPTIATGVATACFLASMVLVWIG